MQLTGSQVIIECLKEQGVDTVFGYPGGVGNGCPADDSVDRIALFQKKLGKIAAILAGDADRPSFTEA